MIRFIAMKDIAYEGHWPILDQGWDETDPIPSFATHDEAVENAVKAGVRKSDVQVFTVEVPVA